MLHWHTIESNVLNKNGEFLRKINFNKRFLFALTIYRDFFMGSGDVWYLRTR